MSFQFLPLGKIRRDGGTQPRAKDKVDESTVNEYCELIKAPEGILPPVTVVQDGADYWLVDGFHRFAAAEKVEKKKIRCHVISGTLADAQWRSFAANKTQNGFRRTNADKRRAVKLALSHPNSKDMTVREIAEHVGVHFTMVADHRAKLNAPVGNLQTDGEQVPAPASSTTPSLPATDAPPFESGETGPGESDSAKSTDVQQPLSEARDQRDVSEVVQPEPSRLRAAAGLERDPIPDGVPISKGDTLSGTDRAKKSNRLLKEARDALGILTRIVANLDECTNNGPRFYTCKARLREVEEQFELWDTEIKAKEQAA